MQKIILVIISIIIVVLIVLYATWLLINSLQKNESKSKSFGEWLKNVFEAIWGL